jgi:DNA uptake protein ComE-like DNA-binding protein
MKEWSRGTLDAQKDGLTGTAGYYQSFTLDTLGNWTGVDDNGASQTRTANAANEITVQWVAQHIDDICLSDAKRQAGKINVNTASREVLLTLPQMTTDTADAIISRRTSSSGQYTNVGQLLGQGMDENLFKAAAEKCCVRSNVFEVHSVGAASRGVRREIVAIIDRGSSTMAILYWWQSE